ncbi:MAG: FHIPEP family type III secretion protein, partial [Spirochaetales bacterium]|nr:FHIPEP family type III secretion protein [Spirochaetales bacterium]
SKFVSGKVKVGILITVVNMIGGMIVGMSLHGEDLSTAVNTYIALTIGDGLVSQFPALLISTATGLIVTRAVSDGSFGEDVTKQFSRQSRIYWIAALFLIVLAFLPGFPWYILAPMGGLFAYFAYTLGKKEAAPLVAEAAAEKAKGKEAQVEISPVVPLDPISLELGYGLIPLVDKDQGAELLDRITRIRKETALDIGLVVPRIRIIDNMRLEPSEYCLKIKGVEVGRGSLRLGSYMAINPGKVKEEVPGEPTRDPAFGLAALWIAEEDRDQAERAGYTVVDPPSIIATHLTEVIKRHAAEILGRQELQAILDTLKKDYPAVVDETLKNLSLGEIQKVLQGLLRERVSIRNMVAILECLADYGAVTKDITFLIEKVRQTLARQICQQYADESKTLRVFTLHPKLEQMIIDSRVETAGGVIAGLKPDIHRQWINTLANSIRSVQEQGYFPIILCSEAARPLVRSSTMRDFPDLVVLSVPEIVPEVKLEALGEIKLEG